MTKSVLLNPQKYNVKNQDQKTEDIMKKTIQFFEHKGLQELKLDDRDYRWYDDYMKFEKDNNVFSTLLTHSGYGDSDSRFDLTRVCAYSELLSFYSLAHHYNYQVSMLGVSPIWMGNNKDAKKKCATYLKEGEIFAFGMSEKEHGADLYSNEMKLSPVGNGA